jgi:hypothetical protein
MSKIKGIFEAPTIVIYSGKDPETAEKFWVNEKELTPEEFNTMMELCPAGASIVFLPAKGEPDEN